MKKEINVFLGLAGLLLSVGLTSSAYADESSYSGNGNIRFEGKVQTQVMDPENPTQVADPGDSPKTNGNLRFDFVPQLNFYQAKISAKDKVYYSNAQLFKNDIGARGNFLQISDYRENKSGWTLQLKQETQFTNSAAKKHKELNGAVLSFDQSWTNSAVDFSSAPTVSKEVIQISNIGELYNLAEAKQNEGEGTWSIIFGSSTSNEQHAETLKPRMNHQNQPILDPNFGNQPMYENQAVTLSVPGKTQKESGNYQTVLTWILSELP
ncbi:WxL domain-containing protein [Enterococcus sp. DIV0242_7C1]|uniref:WxL domain-containing protein n=1 Tax=Candidatus Enterococcus dunnyi TaxID=1834192 RepID=A0A200JBK6_9ENTE|nr:MULTISPECIES: WxL domain-containing protein [unclassified Enterococcus]MBO0471756.1 WxL domain-containing protein [Enterococcus sp. DIV0242_7C1]OUZ34613.1 hypothetical protein A5889_000088 [Enterococcus sp. 9D6_DIV0238]